MQRQPGGSTPWARSSNSCLPFAARSLSSSCTLSKWSSMARLLRPVTKIRSVIPAAAASSTAYWISGLSTIGSISFGLALVAGKKRLPRPATGKTALRSGFVIGSMMLQQLLQALFVDHVDAQLARLVELAAGVFARDDVIR